MKEKQAITMTDIKNNLTYTSKKAKDGLIATIREYVPLFSCLIIMVTFSFYIMHHHFSNTEHDYMFNNTNMEFINIAEVEDFPMDTRELNKLYYSTNNYILYYSDGLPYITSRDNHVRYDVMRNQPIEIIRNQSAR